MNNIEVETAALNFAELALHTLIFLCYLNSGKFIRLIISYNDSVDFAIRYSTQISKFNLVIASRVLYG